MSQKVKYLSEAEVMAINEEMVAKYGGSYGVRDLNLLGGAVCRPQATVFLEDAYKTIFDKAAALFHSIINNHPFLDGNKRTSLFSAILFLEYNGWVVEFSTKEGVAFTLEVHNERLIIEEIANWLKIHSKKA
jgi:death on curing protein